MTKIFISLLFVCLFTSVYAQKNISVTGTIKAETGKGLAKANVLIYYPGTKDTLRAVTNNNGVYNFDNVKAKIVTLVISYIGYKKFEDSFDYSTETGEKTNNDIIMTVGDNMLESVTIESSKVFIKEDTVSYRIDSTMFRKNDNVEEVLKRLPGVEVDKDGKVTAQGTEVTKVRVNGKDFFGGDVKTATRQIDADMVDKIQIIDDYGEQSAFTGVKSGDPSKTLNIQLKKDRNRGVFGNGTLGGGTDKRYLASGALNFFKDAKQISVTGNINNTNASTFDFSRIPGGLGAIAATFRGNNANNSGIAETKTFGLNYRDQLSNKIAVNGSYSYSKRNNYLLTDVFQELPNSKTADSSIFNKQISTNNTITDNHRFDFNVEYTIDSFNYIKFQPGFTFRNQNDLYNSSSKNYYGSGQTVNNAVNSDLNVSKTPNFTGNLLFNHRFKKKGRTLSLNLNGADNYTDGTDDIYNVIDNFKFGYLFSTNIIDQNVLQNNKNYNYGITASFNEQLSKKNGLEFNYSYNKRFTQNDRETFNTALTPNVLLPLQTNLFDNLYTTNRYGVNFRKTLKKYNYAVGLAVQPATIESNTVGVSKITFKQNIVNYFPVVRFAYNFSKSKSLSINYNGSTNQPSFQQSQPVPDISNQQNIIIGNPNLRPEFTNTFNMRYNKFNVISGDVFFGNMNITFTRDKIVNNVINKDFGARETRYLNENGFLNVNGFYAISKPLQNRKYVFNIGGNINYNSYITYLDFNKNKGKNWIVSQRFSMDYKLKKWLEVSGGAVFSLNDLKNSLSTSANNSIKTWSLTHSSRMFFKHDFNFTYDISKSLNEGYTSNVGVNPFIINASLEKLFLKTKNGSIKLQAFDLLNENVNLNRSVSQVNASTTDTRTNRLQRYFMMSLIYRFSKFKGSSKTGPGMQMQGSGMGGMRMGGPGF